MRHVGGQFWVNSRVILGQFWTISQETSGNLSIYPYLPVFTRVIPVLYPYLPYLPVFTVIQCVSTPLGSPTGPQNVLFSVWHGPVVWCAVGVYGRGMAWLGGYGEGYTGVLPSRQGRTPVSGGPTAERAPEAQRAGVGGRSAASPYVRTHPPGPVRPPEAFPGAPRANAAS